MAEKWWMGAVLALWALCAAAQGSAPVPASVSPSGPTDATIPARAFYARPGLESVSLSPSGRWLAILSAGAGDRTGLAIFDIHRGSILGNRMAAIFSNADLRSVHWVNDDRLVFDLLDRQSGGGDQRVAPGLFSVRRDGSELRELISAPRPFISGDRRVGVEPLSARHVLLHIPAGGGDEVIVGEMRSDGTGEPAGVNAKRLNVVTGRAVSLSEGVPDHAFVWMFDPSGRSRLVVTRFQGRTAVHWRAPDSEEWRRLLDSAVDELPWSPRFIDSGGQLFVTTIDPKTRSQVLKRYDFAAGRPSADVLVSTPGFDLRGSIVSETTGARALGVRVVTDAETTVWFDQRLAALQEEADQRLPGLVNRLSCRRCESPDMTVAVTSWSDRDPGQHWLYTAADGQWRKVGNARSEIDPQRMGRTDFHRFRARDGLEIPLWVTTPAASVAGPRPAVLLVHGGPWVRGRSWNWSADAQFLASRGYVVIEPEFRGSTGYGPALYRAGWREWGRKMQDDLMDAVSWTVDQGLVDPKRVCIAGASYGGYATLMGAARDADRFRCAAAWVAVADPRLMFKWSHTSDVWEEGRKYDLPRLIGETVADAAMLESVSPVLLAERMTTPLMLAYGGADRRVPIEHGQQMLKALKAAGHPPEVWTVYDDEGHGWLKLENRVDFAHRLEGFLAKHLK